MDELVLHLRRFIMSCVCVSAFEKVRKKTCIGGSKAFETATRYFKAERKIVSRRWKNKRCSVFGPCSRVQKELEVEKCAVWKKPLGVESMRAQVFAAWACCPAAVDGQRHAQLAGLLSGVALHLSSSLVLKSKHHHALVRSAQF